MELLLDTHIFLWYITGDPRLPSNVLELIREPANEVYLSPVSIWEIIVKYQLGKLPLQQSPEVFIPLQRQRHHLKSLPLDEESVTRLLLLPSLHKDPFDRMLICQAIQNNLTLISTDDAIHSYSDQVLLIR